MRSSKSHRVIQAVPKILRLVKGRESTEKLTQSAPLNPVVGNGIVVEEEKAELTEPWQKDPRLPKHLIPLHYDLYLHPNLNTGLFNGNKLMNSY